MTGSSMVFIQWKTTRGNGGIGKIKNITENFFRPLVWRQPRYDAPAMSPASTTRMVMRLAIVVMLSMTNLASVALTGELQGDRC